MADSWRHIADRVWCPGKVTMLIPTPDDWLNTPLIYAPRVVRRNQVG